MTVSMAGLKIFQRQICSGELARNGDSNFAQIIRRQRAFGNDHGTITLAYAAAAAHQRVVFLEIEVGMKADRGDIVESFIASTQRLRVSMSESVCEKAIARDANPY